MKASKLLLAAVLPLLGCGGVEGGPVDAGASSTGLAAISAVPYWTYTWGSDIGTVPGNPQVSRCTFGDDLAPILVGGFVMDLDHHFGGQVGSLRRACTMEPDVDVLVPLVTVSMDGAANEVRPPERVLAGRVAQFVGAVRDLEVLIDGKSARSLGYEFVRTGAETYQYALPDSGALYETFDGSKEVNPAVADGIFMVLPGLLQGHHQLVISGLAGGRPFRVEYAIDAG